MKIIDIGINLMHRSFNKDWEQVVQFAAETLSSLLHIRVKPSSASTDKRGGEYCELNYRIAF